MALRALAPPGLIDHLNTTLTQFPPLKRSHLIDECMKFLYLVSLTTQRTFIPVDQAIDEIWHACILQTRWYAALCEALPGGDFIHHQSGSFAQYVAVRTPNQTAHEMLQWVVDYVSHFGPFGEDIVAHWVIVKYVTSRYSISTQYLNRLACARLSDRTPGADTKELIR